MIDILLVLIAAAGNAQADAETAEQAAPPAFLAPAPDAAEGSAAGAVPAAPPAFLAPAPEPAGEAPPTFLAPAPESAAEAPPTFLAPAPGGLVAEPQVPSGRFTTATEVRPILNATRGNWIAVREFDGKDLLYVTHLWSWRCGLLEMKIGINGAPPQVWPMPPCHAEEAAPNAVKPEDGLPYAEFPLGSVAAIEVQLTYDDLGTDGARFNRQGVQIP